MKGTRTIPQGEQKHLHEEQQHEDQGDTELWVHLGGAQHQPDPHLELSLRLFTLLGLQTSEAQVLGSATS